MIVCEDALRSRIVIDAIRSAPDVDLVDELQRCWIEHRNFVLSTVAGESVFELGGECDAMNSRCVSDSSNQLAIVRIDYIHLRAMRQVQTPSSAIDRYVVKAAIAGDRVARLDFVSSTALPRNERQDEDRSEEFQGEIHCGCPFLLNTA